MICLFLPSFHQIHHFSLELMQKRIFFTAFGFFEIDFTLIYTVWLNFNMGWHALCAMIMIDSSNKTSVSIKIIRFSFLCFFLFFSSDNFGDHHIFDNSHSIYIHTEMIGQVKLSSVASGFLLNLIYFFNWVFRSLKRGKSFESTFLYSFRNKMYDCQVYFWVVTTTSNNECVNASSSSRTYNTECWP